jgi:endonuclease/exonuclease/phosphatase (EEP) superfamily protein YafD
LLQPARNLLADPPTVAICLVGALAPWSWFLVRDHLGSLGDLLAIGLPWVTFVTLAFLVAATAWRRSVRWMVPLASTLVWAFFAIRGPGMAQGGGAPQNPVHVVAANVRFDNEEIVAATEAAIDRGGDVLVLSEATAPALTALRAAYPYVVTAYEPRFRNDNVVMIGSRFPLKVTDSQWFTGRIVRAEVEAPSGRFVIYGVHAPRPGIDGQGDGGTTFGDHRRFLETLAHRGEQETLPVVIAGDLNASDRMTAYRVLAGPFTDAMRSRSWVGPTYHAGLRWNALLLRIDHVFISPGWCASASGRVDLPGSDHRGVEVNVGACK